MPARFFVGSQWQAVGGQQNAIAWQLQFFFTQPHNCWHRTASFQIHTQKKRFRKMFARQQSDESTTTVQPCRHCKFNARWPLNSKALQDCSTYIVKLDPHDVANTRGHKRAFTTFYRSIMASKILHEWHRYCKVPAPGWHHTCTTSPLHPQPCDFEKNV